MTSSGHSGSRQYFQQATSISTPRPSDQQPSVLQGNGPRMNSSAMASVGGTQILEDTNGSDSDSSELEEGEIDEKNLSPVPTVTKPVPLHAGPARRFKKEPPLHRPSHPPRRDPLYAKEPNFEQFQEHYSNARTPPHYDTPPR